MESNNFLTVLAFVLCSIFIAPVNADSNRAKKDQRYEQRRDMGKSGRQQNQYRKYNREDKKDFRRNSKNSHPGQRKQDLKDHRKVDKKHHRNNGRLNSQRGKYFGDYRKDRYSRSRGGYKDHSRDFRRHEVRRHDKHLVLHTPRHRRYRNIFIIRPYGHTYLGYGHIHHDYDAWRWLTFTAITLKLLDMVDEQAQREHEAAQVAATTAEVGEQIIWDTEDASGYVVTTREGTNSRGLTCREYQHSITVGGKTEEAYGTACLQADGSWKIVK